MHRLYRRANHRNIELLVPNEAGETVGLLLRDGSHKYFRWCGLMSRSEAKLSGGRSVKLAISRIDDRWLTEGEYVQGCLLSEGVYGIIDTEVSVISPHRVSRQWLLNPH